MNAENEDETTSEIDVTDLDVTQSIDTYKQESEDTCTSSKHFHYNGRTSSEDTCTSSKQFHYNGSTSSDEISNVRSKINMRERKRMHDLNVAMDSLREVMPYANGPSVRKLSKIATLSLARNYIQMLTKSVEEMKQLLDDIYRSSARYPSGAGCQSSMIYRPYSNPMNHGLAGIPNTSVYFPQGYERIQPVYQGETRGPAPILGMRNYFSEQNICEPVSVSNRLGLSHRHLGRGSVSAVSSDALVKAYETTE